jgi:hypothetical protein
VSRCTVHRAGRLRVTAFAGVVDEAALLDAYRRVTAAPDFDPGLDDLLDLRGVERLDLGGAAVRRLAAYFDRPNLPNHHARLAIVAPQDYVFGLGRMYEVLRDGAPGQIRVFRGVAEAVAWLGVAPTAPAPDGPNPSGPAAGSSRDDRR